MSYKIKQKFKKGAASFYIVAFSTLILLIVATSFAAVIISEIERTSNDDLSQSAYDSALAGVEDAKLAFYNYQNCMAQSADSRTPLCQNVISYMKNADCDMVGKILGRYDKEIVHEGEVKLKESTADNGGNNMQQAYTCVKVNTILESYKSTLSSSVQTKIVKPSKFANGVTAKDVNSIKISWYSDEDESIYRYNNFNQGDERNAALGVTFMSLRQKLSAVPPTISVALVQTSKDFKFEDFDVSRMSSANNGTTDRGMVYLVPTTDSTSSTNNQVINVDGTPNHRRAWNGAGNLVKATGLLWSNDKTVANRNLPYAVYCPKNAGNGYACSATIELPNPVGGERINDTFMLAVSLPYGTPTTSFEVQFGCGSGGCVEKVEQDDGSIVEEHREVARLDGVQVEVDSTGRANDLYRRVETRLEAAGNDGNLITMGPLELTGNQSGGSGSSDTAVLLDKKFVVKCEYQFGQTCP